MKVLTIILLPALYTSIITPAAFDDTLPIEDSQEKYLSKSEEPDDVLACEDMRCEGLFRSKETEFGDCITIIGTPIYILGKSRIGNGCTLYPFSVIKDCVLEENIIVLPNCVLEGSTFKSGSKIGPFSYVSEGSVIEERAVIGAFVQVKRSTIGAGTKAQHLTYLGDAQIGKNVNIGGGTITCNYNGVSKNKTIINDHALIGSNNSLVAPVAIGHGAMTAAGSTITEDVSDDSLAIARSKQINKLGYASKLLAKFRASKDLKKDDQN